MRLYIKQIASYFDLEHGKKSFTACILDEDTQDEHVLELDESTYHNLAGLLGAPVNEMVGHAQAVSAMRAVTSVPSGFDIAHGSFESTPSEMSYAIEASGSSGDADDDGVPTI